MKSLVETNSGKLISMISSDFFAIEKTLTFTMFTIAAPFTNFVAYLFIGFLIGYEYALMTFAFFIL